jgi:hypothetical protein
MFSSLFTFSIYLKYITYFPRGRGREMKREENRRGDEKENRFFRMVFYYLIMFLMIFYQVSTK